MPLVFAGTSSNVTGGLADADGCCAAAANGKASAPTTQSHSRYARFVINIAIRLFMAIRLFGDHKRHLLLDELVRHHIHRFDHRRVVASGKPGEADVLRKS